MTSVGFARFLDLPLELQGCIWTIVAYASPIRERIHLLTISRLSYPWIQYAVYHTVVTVGSNMDSLASSIQANPVVFSERTRWLWMQIFSANASEQALHVIPNFQSVERAYVSRIGPIRRAVELLLELPNLQELTLDCTSPIASSSSFSATTYPGAFNLTHLICQYMRPTTRPKDFLCWFPRLSHLAIQCDSPPNIQWLRNWYTSTTNPLTLFVILKRWAHNGQVELSDSELLKPRPIVVERVGQVQDLGVQSIWKQYPEMWIAAENALLAAEKEGFDAPFILCSY
ncbi:hypothetical protein DL96DRAFT_121724 [Flagelloscypha sp. PMI_526]|nr:hypothetical protein DL96DRAFT_121724 [Flagelloscypha sp. PMI_526]